jgi:hypothetical protein
MMRALPIVHRAAQPTMAPRGLRRDVRSVHQGMGGAWRVRAAASRGMEAEM